MDCPYWSSYFIDGRSKAVLWCHYSYVMKQNPRSCFIRLVLLQADKLNPVIALVSSCLTLLTTREVRLCRVWQDRKEGLGLKRKARSHMLLKPKSGFLHRFCCRSRKCGYNFLMSYKRLWAHSRICCHIHLLLSLCLAE